MGLVETMRLKSVGSTALVAGRSSRARVRFVMRIPLDWAMAASRVQGSEKALAIGVALCYRAGLERSRTVVLTRGLCRQFGVDKDALRRGLLALEAAKLVSVERSGKAPRVTLLDAPDRVIEIEAEP
jgi:hypothetical protein